MTTPLKRRLVFAVLALTLIASTVVLMADQAGAWNAELTVTTSCQVDGKWTANWSIVNSESESVMEITAEDVTTFAPNPTPFSGTSTSDTTHANDVASVTANVTVHWPENETISYSATALRPEGCVVPPPLVTPDPTPVLIPPMVIERSEAAVPVVTAPAAPPELPRTGTATGPLAAAGFGLIGVGMAAVAARRRLA